MFDDDQNGSAQESDRPTAGTAVHCPYCRDRLSAPLVVCARCNAEHHEECWNANGSRCSIFGCGSDRMRRLGPDSSAHGRRGQNRRRRGRTGEPNGGSSHRPADALGRDEAGPPSSDRDRADRAGPAAFARDRRPWTLAHVLLALLPGIALFAILEASGDQALAATSPVWFVLGAPSLVLLYRRARRSRSRLGLSIGLITLGAYSLVASVFGRGLNGHASESGLFLSLSGLLGSCAGYWMLLPSRSAQTIGALDPASEARADRARRWLAVVLGGPTMLSPWILGWAQPHSSMLAGVLTPLASSLALAVQSHFTVSRRFDEGAGLPRLVFWGIAAFIAFVCADSPRMLPLAGDYLALFLLPGFWMAMMAIVGGLVLPGRRRRLASGSLSALTLLLPFVLDASPIEDHVLRYAGCAIVFALLCVAVLFLTTVRQPLGVRRWLSAPFPIVLAVSMVAGRTPVDASTLVALAILAAYAVARRFFLERYEHPVPETPEIVVGGPRG